MGNAIGQIFGKLFGYILLYWEITPVYIKYPVFAIIALIVAVLIFWCLYQFFFVVLSIVKPNDVVRKKPGVKTPTRKVGFVRKRINRKLK